MTAPRALRAAVLAAAIGSALAFVGVALARMSYPFELEWSEGIALEQVGRVLAGQPLYAEPGLGYVAAPYPPAYPFLSALVAAVLGPGFLPLRLVSFLCACGCIVLIAATVQRLTGAWIPALLAGGLFAATFRASGSWLDVARVDSLALFLLLLAVFLLAAFPGRGVAAAAGAVLALAFFAKQTTLVAALVLIAALLLFERGRGLWLGAVTVLGAAGGTLLLDRLYGGWFSYFAFRPHPILPSRLLHFWTTDVLRVLPVAVILAAVLLARPDPDIPQRGRRLLWSAAAALVAASWAGRLVSGAVANALMPGYAGLSLLFGAGWHEARSWIARVAAGVRPRIESLAAVAALVQFLSLAYDPRGQVPSRADRQAGENLLATIAATPGRILVPYHPYLLTMAGKPAHAHYACVFDVASFGGGSPAQRLMAEAQGALRRADWEAVITDSVFTLAGDMQPAYRLHRPLWETAGAFRPLVGAPLKPEALWLPAYPGGSDARRSMSVPSGPRDTVR